MAELALEISVWPPLWKIAVFCVVGAFALWLAGEALIAAYSLWDRIWNG